MHNLLREQTLQEQILMVALYKFAEQVEHYKTNLNGGQFTLKEPS